MSLKDHLRSLGDKEFLQELANSEPDALKDKSKSSEAADDAAKPANVDETSDGVAAEKPEAIEAETVEAAPEDEVAPEKESQHEDIEPVAAEPKESKPLREASTKTVNSRTADIDMIEQVIVTIEADQRKGRGFVVDGEGKIVTNLHLVDSASRIRVSLPSGDIFLGKLLKSDIANDLALIQIPARTPTHASFGDPDKLDVGDDVLVLGKASSALGKMVRAVICGLRVLDGTKLIQTNQSIAPADSGSPFVFPDGRVIGISNCKMGDDIADSGFAVSVKDLKVFISSR